MKRVFKITETKILTTNIFDESDEEAIEKIIKKCLGLHPTDVLDDNLKQTPKRYLKLLTEMTEGYRTDPSHFLEKVFPVNSPNLADDEDEFDETKTDKQFHKGIVVVSTNAWSNCCHHLAPMNCRVDVAYIPVEKVVGLSKIVRCVKMYGRRFNLQEAWGENIANAMMKKLNPLGVMVRISGIHSCVAMRGAAEQTSKTTTMTIRGCFSENVAARTEAISLMDRNNIF